MAKRGKKNENVLNDRMRKKLVVLFFIVLAAFALLIFRLYLINRDNGEEYKRKVLSQQSYDSRELPYKRGTITDSKGTVLAQSELVYNIVVDAFVMNSGSANEQGISEYIDPTMAALNTLGVANTDAIRTYVLSNPESRYYIVKKNLPYLDYKAYQEERAKPAQKVADIRAQIREEQEGAAGEALLANLESQLETAREELAQSQKVQGIWFEEAYIRSYPGGSLAADVIGFANTANVGSFGLEEYYNSTLNGTAGREYGYLTDTSQLERTTIPATDGNNLVLTLDANIQSICEKYLYKFNEAHKDAVRPGYGANNVGVIIQNVNNGEILAMASSPTFDLQNPYSLDPVVGMPVLNSRDAPTSTYMTEADVRGLTEDKEKSRYLNALWNNFCISTYYEPGSVGKCFTLASGLESGKLTGNEVYHCDGSLNIGGWDIYCHNRDGDGDLTTDEAIERSCNVALMKMAEMTGITEFTRFQRIFNFGLKTNIDLAKEARTDLLLISADRMGVADLATNSFGQNYDVTMIQMITAFSSLINGGYYYEPHLVKKITSASGATVKNIEPRLIKKTVSQETSAKIREATIQVVEGLYGTGRKARPAGYRIGGKTGTAETLPRKNGEYVVSFIGFAPADDPQIAIYAVIDRVNDSPQDQAAYACVLVHDILTEVLPYMNIYMTEPLSEAEEEQLLALNLANTYAYGVTNLPINIIMNMDTTGDGQLDSLDADGDGVPDEVIDTNGDGITDAVDTDGDHVADLFDADNDGIAESTEAPLHYRSSQVVNVPRQVWKNYTYDAARGGYIDPVSGGLIDPETGYYFETSTMEGDAALSDVTEAIMEENGIEPMPAAPAEEPAQQTEGESTPEAETAAPEAGE